MTNFFERAGRILKGSERKEFQSHHDMFGLYTQFKHQIADAMGEHEEAGACAAYIVQCLILGALQSGDMLMTAQVETYDSDALTDAAEDKMEESKNYRMGEQFDFRVSSKDADTDGADFVLYQNNSRINRYAVDKGGRLIVLQNVYMTPSRWADRENGISTHPYYPVQIKA